MRYMLLIYTKEAESSASEMHQVAAAHGEIMAETARRGILRGAEPLEPSGTATTVRVQNGKAVMTDGPFAETKEQLAGYYILDCADLDEALEWAAKIPTSCGGGEGCVEVRPVRAKIHPSASAEYVSSVNG
ncbi:MAG: hypothetical protein DMG66_04960 [Acidobacteria bacterium]|nr:MAG: hypothetical protein DMG66_04960 [Acidobacteriota bacterium]